MALSRMTRIAAATPTQLVVSQRDLENRRVDRRPDTTPADPGMGTSATGTTQVAPPVEPPLEAPPAQAPTIPDSGATRTAVNNALSRIATFIPTEALALYMILLGIFVGTSSSRQYELKWGLFGAGVASIIFAVVAAYVASHRAGKKPEGKRYFSIFVLALASFTIYAMAIPDNPFESIQLPASLGVELNQIAAGLAAIAAFAFPTIAEWLGVPMSDSD